MSAEAFGRSSSPHLGLQNRLGDIMRLREFIPPHQQQLVSKNYLCQPCHTLATAESVPAYGQEQPVSRTTSDFRSQVKITEVPFLFGNPQAPAESTALSAYLLLPDKQKKPFV